MIKGIYLNWNCCILWLIGVGVLGMLVWWCCGLVVIGWF